jgi:hypothetical protein
MKTHHWISARVRDIESEKPQNAILFVCFSDSYGYHRNIGIRVFDKCDIAICAGDFSNYGDYETVKNFGLFFGSSPSRYKVCFDSNHKLSFSEFTHSSCRSQADKSAVPPEEIKSLISDDPFLIYLEKFTACVERVRFDLPCEEAQKQYSMPYNTQSTISKRQWLKTRSHALSPDQYLTSLAESFPMCLLLTQNSAIGMNSV